MSVNNCTTSSGVGRKISPSKKEKMSRDAEGKYDREQALLLKQQRHEELRLKVQQLREDRVKRQQNRIQLLKTINTQKALNQSLPATSVPKHDKSLNVSTIPCKQNGAASTVPFKQNGNNSTVLHKQNGAQTVSCKQNTVSYKQNSNSSIISNRKPSHVLPTAKNVLVTTKDTLSSKLTISEPIKINNYRKSIAPKVNTFRMSVRPDQQQINKSIVQNGSNKNEDSRLKKEPNTVGLFPKKSMTTFDVIAKSSKAVIKPMPSMFNGNENFNVRKASVQDTKPKRWTMSSVNRLSKPRVMNKAPVKTETNTVKNTIKPIKQNGIQANKDDKVLKKPSDLSGLRRSLSTVHFKRLGPEEAKKCFKRTLSVGNFKRKDIEDELPDEYQSKGYFLPIESERKKSVSFLTPLRKSSTPKVFLNTPKPSELRKRLNDWLQRRGKSLSTYHHLKCFGIDSHNVPVATIDEDSQLDDENKENVEILDDDSFNENMSGNVKDMAADWRQASFQLSESISSVLQQSPNDARKAKVLSELTPRSESKSMIDPLITDALFDLHQLILEGYSWTQCAEWLRAIVRDCGDDVKNISAYWECRAALEEKRGDFVRTVDCFNNALQRGGELCTIEESLDNLLDKFMKLNLDPNCDKTIMPTQNQKLIDVKNVFKTSLIRFAIKQQNQEENEKPKFLATPVRRSSRISTANGYSHINKSSPKFNGNLKSISVSEKGNQLKQNKVSTIENAKINVSTSQSITKSNGRKHLVQLCDSLRNVDNDVRQTLIFVPNKALNFNDCI